MGIIYMIKNLENDKIYVGQTVKSLDERFKDHISLAKNIQNPKADSLYYDMRKYGLSAFKCYKLEDCDNANLQERERYYIELYDSYNNGYNQNRGGQAYFNSYDNFRNRAIELIKEGKSATEVASELGTQLQFVRSVAQANELELVKKPTGHRLEVFRYDQNYSLIGRYSQITEAYRSISDIYAGESSFQHNVRTACKTGKFMYNSFWAIQDDLRININGVEYIFRQPLDKKQYANGAKFRIDNNVVIVDEAKKDADKVLCKFCGKEVDNSIGICEDCALKYKRSRLAVEYRQLFGLKVKKEDNSLIKKQKVSKIDDSQEDINEKSKYKSQKPTLKDKLPDKDKLLELMEKYNYREIANMYGVYERTLREVLRDYGIYKEKIARNVDEKQLALDILNMGMKEAASIHNVSQWKAKRVADMYGIEKWMYDNSKPVYSKQLYNGEIRVFGSLKDAARENSQQEAQAQQINSLGYRIGQSIRDKSICCNCTWGFIDKKKAIEGIIEKIKNT